jgi:hypothetical protein
VEEKVDDAVDARYTAVKEVLPPREAKVEVDNEVEGEAVDSEDRKKDKDAVDSCTDSVEVEMEVEIGQSFAASRPYTFVPAINR